MKKRSGNFIIPAIMGIGITGGFGLLAFNDAPRLLQVPEPRASIPLPEPEPEPRLRITNDAPRVQQAPAQPQQQPQRRQAEPQPTEKQTVFTDRNYTPRAADNVVRGERVAPVQKPESRTTGITVTGIKETPKVSDYCPGGEGSIIRRNCKMAVDLNRR